MTLPVTYEFEAGIATITLDDGKANVMTESTLRALHEAFERAQADDAVVLFTGRERIFSGGYDLSLFSRPREEIVRTLRLGGELTHRIHAFPRPVLVACNGHAVAQGAFLLLAADVRIGVSGNFKLGFNEVVIGLTIPHYGVEIARARLSPSWFQHATLTGTFYPPQDALVAGFLDRVVEPSELAALAREEAQKLVKLNRNAHAGTKLRVRSHSLQALRVGIDSELGGA